MIPAAPSGLDPSASIRQRQPLEPAKDLAPGRRSAGRRRHASFTLVSDADTGPAQQLAEVGVVLPAEGKDAGSEDVRKRASVPGSGQGMPEYGKGPARGPRS